MEEKKCLRPKEIQKIYGIPIKTLANWRAQGKGPVFFKLGKAVYYPADKFEEWLKKNAVLVKTTETL